MADVRRAPPRFGSVLAPEVASPSRAATAGTTFHDSRGSGCDSPFYGTRQLGTARRRRPDVSKHGRAPRRRRTAGPYQRLGEPHELEGIPQRLMNVVKLELSDEEDPGRPSEHRGWTSTLPGGGFQSPGGVASCSASSLGFCCRALQSQLFTHFAPPIPLIRPCTHVPSVGHALRLSVEALRQCNARLGRPALQGGRSHRREVQSRWRRTVHYLCYRVIREASSQRSPRLPTFGVRTRRARPCPHRAGGMGL